MKRINITSIVTIFVLVVSFFAVCAAGASNEVTITFYHTSDIHENSENLARIAQFIQDQKTKNPNVLFLDTGDWFNLGDLTDLDTRGEAIVELMSAMKYDAVILGNNDYSFGTERLVELVEKYPLPLLTANCIWPENMKPKTVAQYKIFKFNSVKVAVIGTASTILNHQEDKLLKILPIDQSVKNILDKLDRRADIIVLMTHLGVRADQWLTRELPRVDIIFGGHDHEEFETLNFDKENQTIIQHSGSFGQDIGEVVIKWDGKKIVDREAGLVDIPWTEIAESTKIKNILNRYID
ncbi:bifunctional metallophosphatase/5'-nucleotidase [Thermodesulfobacteriota bacterium]